MVETAGHRAGGAHIVFPVECRARTLVELECSEKKIQHLRLLKLQADFRAVKASAGKETVARSALGT
jgi:hypothetical protein